MVFFCMFQHLFDIVLEKTWSLDMDIAKQWKAIVFPKTFDSKKNVINLAAPPDVEIRLTPLQDFMNIGTQTVTVHVLYTSPSDEAL